MCRGVRGGGGGRRGRARHDHYNLGSRVGCRVGSESNPRTLFSFLKIDIATRTAAGNTMFLVSAGCKLTLVSGIGSLYTFCRDAIGFSRIYWTDRCNTCIVWEGRSGCHEVTGKGGRQDLVRRLTSQRVTAYRKHYLLLIFCSI